MKTCTIGTEGELTKTFDVKSAGECRLNATMETIEVGKPTVFATVNVDGKVDPSDTGVTRPSGKDCVHTSLADSTSPIKTCIRGRHIEPIPK